MENNEEETEMAQEEDSSEIEQNEYEESMPSALLSTLRLDSQEAKSSVNSNSGSIAKSRKTSGQSKLSVQTLQSLKTEISMLRQSLTSNTKRFSSKTSRNGSETSKRFSTENQLEVDNGGENRKEIISYGSSQNEIIESQETNTKSLQKEPSPLPESKTPTHDENENFRKGSNENQVTADNITVNRKGSTSNLDSQKNVVLSPESNNNSPKIRGKIKPSISTLKSPERKISSSSKTFNFQQLSSNDENSGRASNISQSMIENVAENKKGKKSYEERTLSQVSQNEIGENPTLEKSEKNKKVSSPRNEILETIKEDEEVTDGDREHLGMDKLNLKPVEDGKKSISYKEVASKKHNVRNSKTAKNEKGVQFPITTYSRTQDVSNRKYSVFDSKKNRVLGSSSSLLQYQSSNFGTRFKTQGQHQLGPCLKFSTKQVENILQECIEVINWKMLTNKKEAPKFALKLAAEALRSVKAEYYDRYRICVQVVTGDNFMQGVHLDAQCLWDRNFDCFAKC